MSIKKLGSTKLTDDLLVGSVNLSSEITGTLGVGNGGTGQTSYTDGQLLIGNTTGNTLTKSTLTAGTNVTITNGPGSITISAAGAASQWVTTGSNIYYSAGNVAIGTNAPDPIIRLLLQGTGSTTSTYGLYVQNSAALPMFWVNDAGNASVTNGQLFISGNTALHAGNYNSYAPSLTGSGASGTWGISVTGNAATVSSITSGQVTTALGYTPLSGNQTITLSGDATGSGATSIAVTLANSGVANGTYGGNNSIPRITVDLKGRITGVSTITPSGTWGIDISGNAANVTGTVAIANGGTGATSAAVARTNLGATTVGGNFFTLANPSAIGFVRVNADNTVSLLNGAGFRDAINVPTRTGGDASGTWAISITGSAATATTATNQSGGTVNATTGAFSSAVSLSGSTAINTTTPGLTAGNVQFAGSSVADQAQSITWSWGGSNAQAGVYVQSSGSYGTKMYLATTDSFATGSKTAISIDHSGNVNVVRGALTQGGNQVLHAGNFSSYALPLSGGTLTGLFNASAGAKIAVQNGTDGGFDRGIFLWTSGDSNWGIYMAQAGAGRSLSNGTAPSSIDGRTAHAVRFRAYGSDASRSFIWENDLNICVASLTPDTGNFYTRGQIYAGNSTSNVVLHAGNYSSYALPLSGGTVTGLTSFTAAESLNLYGVRGLFSAGSDGNGIHLYSNVVIGDPNGWGNGLAATPSRGLSTWGGIRVAYGNSAASTFAGSVTSTGGSMFANAFGLNGGFTISDPGSGYGQFNNWVRLSGVHGFYSSVNSAHFYPNDASYGAWRIDGSRNGYNGISFNGGNGQTTLMIDYGSSNVTGFHNQNYGWQFYWSSGTMYVFKNAYGGGTQATVLDSSNYSSYALPLSGGSVSGAINFTNRVNGVLVNASGTGSADASIAIQQVTAEGWTGIFCDFEPYTGWGFWHDNPNNYFSFTAEASAGSLRSFTVPSRLSGNRTAYEKVRIEQGSGDMRVGGNLYITTSGHLALHAGNYSSYALPLSGGTMSGIINSVGLQCVGIGGNSGVSGDYYKWGYQESGSWTYPYPDLVLAYHTGMKFGANTNYGGMRFYADHPFLGPAELFSIGNGDSNVRVAASLIASSAVYSSNWFRSYGATGWYNESYGGGIWMSDSTWVRVYGTKDFYATASIAAVGNVTAYYSDERLKTKMGVIDSALAKVRTLAGFLYVENDTARKVGYKNTHQQVGVSAQAVQRVLPEAVSLAPFDMHTDPDTGEITSKSGENYLTVDYSRLVPLLIEAIKELADAVEGSR